MYNIAEKVQDSNIVILKSVAFFEEEIHKYKQKFQEYKESGNIVKTKNFEENIWRFSDEVQNVQLNFDLDELRFKGQKKVRKFTFELPDLITALKCFTLILLEEYSVKSVSQIKMIIVRILNDTNYFNINCLGDFKRKYMKKPPNPFFYNLQWIS